MKVEDMETITESLEKSMQNCSLTDRRRRVVGGHGFGRSNESNQNTPISDRTLELNSHVSLPRHWEQCLDLKTGEIYYINWKNGMKVRDDPRKVMNADLEMSSGESSYGTMGSEEDSSYYDSEESSSESSPSSSRETHKEEDEEEGGEEEEDVLVVAGCKACFMYFMVPKHVEDCPKCAAQLLHFDRSHVASP